MKSHWSPIDTDGRNFQREEASSGEMIQLHCIFYFIFLKVYHCKRRDARGQLRIQEALPAHNKRPK